MDLNQNSILKWFSGMSVPDQTNVVRLATLLRVNAQWLQVGPGSEVIPDNNDDFWEKIRPLLPHLDERAKTAILHYAQIEASSAPKIRLPATFPNENEPEEPGLELPPFRDPITK